MVFQEKKKKEEKKNIKTVLYLVSELTNSIIRAPVLNSCLIPPWSDSKLYSKCYNRGTSYVLSIYVFHIKKKKKF